MLSVPVALTQLIIKFAPLLSKRVWAHAQVMVVGALLAPGKRAVTAVLRVMGLSQERQFQKYHRVLNRAVVESGHSPCAAGHGSAHLRACRPGRHWDRRHAGAAARGENQGQRDLSRPR